MICDDVCTLIQEDPAAHGIFDPAAETETQVFCTVQSVGRYEFFRALENGIEPRWVLRLTEFADYHGEKIVLFRGDRYRVIRTYVDSQAIELTIGEVKADARET